MRLTFTIPLPVFTIVTTLRTFQIQARDLASARAEAPGIIIAVAETLIDVQA